MKARLLAVAAACLAGALSAAVEVPADCDVCVVGAGPAGVGAALASAAAGARTVVLERNGFVGGTTVSAEVTDIGLFHAWRKQVIDGPCYRLVTNAMARGNCRLPDVSLQDGDRNWTVGCHTVKPRVYEQAAREALLGAGIDLRLGATAVGAEEAPGGWRLAYRRGGELRALVARCVVDASGNAAVAAMAGAGRVKSDDATRQPGSYFFWLNTSGMSFDAAALDRAQEEAVRKGELLPTDLHVAASQFVRAGGGWGVYVPLADDSTEELRAETNRRGEEAKARIVGFLRRQPGLADAAVVRSARDVGVRETYRVVGEETITQADYLSGKLYPDSLCWSFWMIDPHDARAKAAKLVFHENGAVGAVRLGAMVPKGVRGMLVAGRAVSSDHGANSALRVQASCMGMGQVAGVAAALAARQGRDVRCLDLSEVRAALRAMGAIVPPDAAGRPAAPFGFVTVGPESAKTNAILAIERVRLDLRRSLETNRTGAVVTVLPGVPDVVFDAVRHLDRGGNVRVVDARRDDPARARDEMVARMLPDFGPGANPCLKPRWKDWGAVSAIRQRAEKARGELVVDAVMVGDSITAGWHLGKETTDRLFPGWDVVSLACSGDRVQDQLGSCLWGGLDGYRAKLVQVMVGTNNALENRPEDIAGGIRRLVGVIREKQPDARILLMPIFPCRNRHAPGAPNLHREATDQVNALIRPLADGDRVVWFELYDEWLDERGRARKDLFRDGLHPNAAGYALWAERMKPHWEKARADWRGDVSAPAAIPLPDRKARESLFAFTPVTSNTWQLAVDPRAADLTPAGTHVVDVWLHRHPGSHVLVHPCGDGRLDAFFALRTWGTRVCDCPFPLGDARAEPYLDALRKIEGRGWHEVPLFRGPTSFHSNEWWTRGVSHRKMIESGEVKDCDIVFWGDSITHGWERVGKEAQERHFGNRKVFNIAVSGDTVAGCLWNAENGLLDGYRTKCVMLMIGTNNGGVPEIVPGVKRLLALVREKQPDAVTFLLPIFPRGAGYAKGEAPAERRGTNAGLRGLCDGDKARFVDFNDRFLDAEGRLPKELFPDFVHPSAAGYEIWARAMKPHFDAVLDRPPAGS